MEGKKKMNKKKKGNSQSKLTHDVPASVEQVVVPNQDNESSPLLNHFPQVSSMTDVQSVGVSEADIETDKHNVYDKKFIKLQEEIRQLEYERNQWLQKEASLVEKIQLLQNDVDSCLKKEASFEEKLNSLQSGNDFLMQKQANFEDRVNHIEVIKDSWILKETMINEMASRLDDINLKLQEPVKEVKELKESREYLVQENAKLREGISVIESRVQCIETLAFLSKSSSTMITKQSSVEEIPQSKPEAAPSPLSDMQEQEKTEVVEKVKEVQIESEQHVNDASPSLSPEFDHEKKSTESSVSIDDYPPNYGAEMYESGEMIHSLVRASDPFGTPNGAENFGTLNGRMDIPRISEDVVSVPLDDIQVNEVQRQSEEEEETPLPLSDAPLIGAPFRLISFFAKYVSGADLVHQDGN